MLYVLTNRCVDATMDNIPIEARGSYPLTGEAFGHLGKQYTFFTWNEHSIPIRVEVGFRKDVVDMMASGLRTPRWKMMYIAQPAQAGRTPA